MHLKFIRLYRIRSGRNVEAVIDPLCQWQKQLSLTLFNWTSFHSKILSGCSWIFSHFQRGMMVAFDSHNKHLWTTVYFRIMNSRPTCAVISQPKFCVGSIRTREALWKWTLSKGSDNLQLPPCWIFMLTPANTIEFSNKGGSVYKWIEKSSIWSAGCVSKA